jgi:hypothetical protein
LQWVTITEVILEKTTEVTNRAIEAREDSNTRPDKYGGPPNQGRGAPNPVN